MVVPSAVRIARSIASRNCSAPPERNASSPINSALTVAGEPLADRVEPAARLDDLHVVVVVAVLAVNRDTNSRLPVVDRPFHQRARNERVAVPRQAVARQLLARHVERAGIVGDLVEGIVDGRTFGPRSRRAIAWLTSSS